MGKAYIKIQLGFMIGRDSLSSANKEMGVDVEYMIKIQILQKFSK